MKNLLKLFRREISSLPPIFTFKINKNIDKISLKCLELSIDYQITYLRKLILIMGDLSDKLILEKEIKKLENTLNKIKYEQHIL